MKMKLLDFVYPRLCLHCQKNLLKNLTLFCEECTPFFELLEYANRCPHCFVEQERKGACSECREKKRWYITVAACMERRGPLLSFLNALERMPYLGKTAASFMMIQLEHLSWKPDVLFPIPRPWWQFLWKGRNVEYLIAKELSHILDIPLLTKKRIADSHVLMIDLELNRTRIDKNAEKLFPYYPRKVSALTLVG